MVWIDKKKVKIMGRNQGGKKIKKAVEVNIEDGNKELEKN